MEINMNLPSKSPIDYNAKDIFSIFTSLYEDKFHAEYLISGFIGHEMHLLKEAIVEHSPYDVACAVFNGVRSNDRTVNIPYIVAGLRYYIPTSSSRVYWYVHTEGTKEIKQKWKQCELLGATWLPSATQNQRLKQLSNDLRKWTNAKEKQHGATPKKRGARKSTKK